MGRKGACGRDGMRAQIHKAKRNVPEKRLLAHIFATLGLVQDGLGSVTGLGTFAGHDERDDL